MRILIDGRAFNIKGSSISVYLFNLLNEIFKLKNNEYILVLNNKNYIKEFDKFKNVQLIYSEIRNNLFWDNLIIPYFAIKTKSNVIFYPKGSTSLFRVLGKKIVVTIHGMIYKIDTKVHSRIENIYWRFIGKLASLISNQIIAVSENDKQVLISEGYSAKKIEVIPIGISKIFFTSANQVVSKKILRDFNLEEKQYIIQVGHITKKKNQEFTINLFKEIFLNYPKLKLVFVGSKEVDKAYYGHLVELIKEYSLQNKIIFTNSIDQNKHKKILPTLIQNSILFVFPSTYEGFGMPVVEAIASKVPVLSSNSGAIPEIIGVNNTLDINNKDLWISMIKTLIDNKRFYKKIVSQQSMTIKRYKWDKISNEYNKLFDKIWNEK